MPAKIYKWPLSKSELYLDRPVYPDVPRQIQDGITAVHHHTDAGRTGKLIGIKFGMEAVKTRNVAF